MNQLTEWFARQRRRQKAVVLLEEALLSGKFAPYAVYRLRLFGVRVLAGLLRHATEFFLVVTFFSAREAAVVLLVQAMAFLVTAFWWGGLEKMRQKVRAYYREGGVHRAPAVIRVWVNTALTLSAFLSLALMLAIVVAVIWGVRISAASLFVIMISLRIVVDLPLSAYHSGIYAIRRVYRPLYAVLMVEVVAAILTLSLRGPLGNWSLPIIATLTTIITTSVTCHFVTQAYRYARLLPLGLDISLNSLKRGIKHFDRLFVWAGGAYALAQTEWLIVVAFILVNLRHSLSEFHEIAACYLIGPIASASREWVQLFYFDLKKLELEFCANIKSMLERNMEFVALAIAGLCWAGACLMWILFCARLDLWFVCASAPLFFAHSILAYQQMRVFASRGYVTLASASLILLTISAIAFLLGQQAFWVIVFVFTGMLWMISILSKNESPSIRVGGTVSFAYLAWMLGTESGYGRLGVANIREGCSKWWRIKIAQRISRVVGQNGSVAIIGSKKVIWYEKNGENINKNTLYRECWGLIEGVKILPPIPLTAENIMNNLEELKLVSAAGEGIGLPKRDFAEEIKAEFSRLFPYGKILDVRPGYEGNTIAEASKGGVVGITRQSKDGGEWIAGRCKSSTFSLRGLLILAFFHENFSDKNKIWIKFLRQYEAIANLYAAGEDKLSIGRTWGMSK